jgi:hypothetical protein
MPDIEADLTDLLLRIKRAFDGADMSALTRLFVPGAKTRVLGKSLFIEEFALQLGDLLERVAEPTLSILHVDRAEVQVEAPSAAYAAEVSLIDTRTRQLGRVRGLLTIVAVRAEPKSAPRKRTGKNLARPEKERWLIREMTFERME